MKGWISPCWAGLRLRCPSCGVGKIYAGLTRMNPRCSRCGVIFERDEGDFLGAICIAYSVTAVLVAVGIYLLEIFTDLNPYGHLLIWSLFAALFLWIGYRHMKGLWIGILHVMIGLTAENSQEGGDR